MPEKEVTERAREDVREGKHGAQSSQQAIAIGLSKARRAGVRLPAPRKGKTSSRTRKQAQRDLRKGRGSRGRRPSRTRSRAISKALRREGSSAASRSRLSAHARAAARRRGSRSRHQSAGKGVRTKGRPACGGGAQSRVYAQETSLRGARRASNAQRRVWLFRCRLNQALAKARTSLQW
jgi:hypothetical protein